MPEVKRLAGGKGSGVVKTRAGSTKSATGSAVDRIRNMGFDEDEGIKMLVYGVSGSGKTTLWSTFPKPILAVLASGGDNPGELRSIDTPENRKGVYTVTLLKSEEMPELLAHARGEFATVVLDHASGLQDLVLKEILNLEEVPVEKTWGLASMEDYGVCARQCKTHLAKLLSLPCNVVIVAQERVFTPKNDESGEAAIGRTTVGPDVIPSLCRWLCPACDYNVQTYTDQKYREVVVKTEKKGKIRETKTKKMLPGVDYYIRCSGDVGFMTKFRVPRGAKMPYSLRIGADDSHYERMMAYVRGEGEKEE